MDVDWQTTRIQCSIDLAAGGRSIGDLRLKHSDDAQPLGYRPIPIAVLAGGEGPTVLLTGGVHGDEFEGPIALMKLVHRLDPASLRGRLVVLPALNAPAVAAARRTSPLDGGNLNRAFPGDRNGGPTAMIAHLVEEVLLPHCDACIDLHAGGRAAVFAHAALATRTADRALFARNMALAEAFGTPFIWILGALNDDRSHNAAAARKGVAMIAAELGGGGTASPASVRAADDGIARCLRHLGMIDAAPPASGAARLLEMTAHEQTLSAPRSGLFEPLFKVGEEVESGEVAGAIHAISEPERPPLELTFAVSGVVLARGNRGLVERGDMLALVARDAEV